LAAGALIYGGDEVVVGGGDGKSERRADIEDGERERGVERVLLGCLGVGVEVG
jgi:hypothetical protein